MGNFRFCTMNKYRERYYKRVESKTFRGSCKMIEKL